LEVYQIYSKNDFPSDVAMKAKKRSRYSKNGRRAVAAEGAVL